MARIYRATLFQTMTLMKRLSAMRMKCLAIKEEKMFRLGPRLRTFRKTRRRQQRGRGKTTDLMSRTIAQHVRLAVPCKMTT